MARLYYLRGLPRSGKSTWADAWLEDRVPGEPPRVVLSGDDFRHAVYGRDYLPECEGLVFAALDTAARALLRRGFDVLIDETCTTQSTLFRYLKIDLDAVPVFIDTPEEECLRRAVESGKDYLVGPIRRHAAQLEVLKRDWKKILPKLKKYVLQRRGIDVAV